MKGKIVLAESATSHPDGTFSLLRGGITHVWAENPPYGFRGSLVVRIEADLADKGQHRFDLRCMSQDGVEVMPTIQGQFDVPQGGGFHNLVMGLGTAFPEPGQYVFVVRVDEVEQDRWTMHVIKGRPERKPAP